MTRRGSQKAGAAAKRGNKAWRIHSAFDLPRERFGHFELTDRHGGGTLDRIPVVKGEIRVADRAYLQPDRIARVLDQQADVLIQRRLEKRPLAPRRGRASRSSG